jgi:hypothetical protein
MRRLLVGIALLLVGAAAVAAPPSWQASRTKEAPAIDGKLDDACWKDQTLVSNFVDARTGQAARAQTLFRVLYDDTALYLAIQCLDPQVKDLRATLEARDDTVWDDDCVEVLLDPSNRHDSYARLVMNARGALYDAWMTHGGVTTDMDYESGAQVAAATTAEGWQLEVKVPYAGLRLPGDVKSAWGLNLCRHKKTQPTEVSCWSGPQGDQQGQFGALTGLKVNFRAQLVSIDTPQFVDPRYDEGKLIGTLKVPYVNWTGRGVATRIKATFKSLEGLSSENQTEANLGRGRGMLMVPVVVGKPGFSDVSLEVVRRQPESVLFEGRFPMRLDYPPITISLQEPAYRDTIYASLPSSEIVCRMKVNAPVRDLAGCELRAALSAGNTEMSVRTVRTLLPRGEATVAFSSEIIPAGDYLIRAQVLKQGEVIVESAKMVRKLKPQAREVILDAQGHLRVNSRRFFPFGFADAVADARMSQAKCNTLHLAQAWKLARDGKLQAALDDARKLSLAVVLPPYPDEVTAYGFRGHAVVTDEDLRDIQTFVAEYASHPAVLAWEICREPRGALWRASLEKVYQTVAATDPYHPCVAVDSDAALLSRMGYASDIPCLVATPGFAADGGPRQPLATISQALADVAAGQPTLRAPWLMPQGFSQGDLNPEQAATDRAPTLSEVRCMQYLGLLGGAEGVLAQDWTRATNHPSVWNTYKEALGPEMAILVPMLHGGETVANCRVSNFAQTPKADVILQAWKDAEGLAIVAVNRGPEEARVRVYVPRSGGKRFRVLAEDRYVVTVTDSFDETLPPYGVHIYTDKQKLPSILPLEQLAQHIKNDEAAQKQTW